MTARNAPVNAWINRSGTIADHTVAQQLVGANPSRRRLIIQNPTNAGESLWISYIGDAAVGGAGSFEIVVGQIWDDGYDAATGLAVSVIANTNGHAFTCIEGQ